MKGDDAVRELALKLVGVCARERGDLNWSQLYLALALAVHAVVSSCPCPRCRERVMRHAKYELLKELRSAAEYSVEKYAGVVGHC